MNRLRTTLFAAATTAAVLAGGEVSEAAKYSPDRTSVTVERGDTLTKIAKLTGVPVATLVAVNHITNVDHIEIGQRLVLSDPNAPICPDVIKRATDLTPGCLKLVMGKLVSAGYTDAANGNVRLAAREYQLLNPEQGLHVDGRLGRKTATAILHDSELLPPFTSSIPNGVVIDKSEQTGRLIKDSAVVATFAVSTGTGNPYEELGSDGKIHRGQATTPTGTFVPGRKMPADYVSPLGQMPNAVFLRQPGKKYDTEIAIHGGNVNTEGPTGLSHGCVRVDFAVAPLVQTFVDEVPDPHIVVQE